MGFALFRRRRDSAAEESPPPAQVAATSDAAARPSAAPPDPLTVREWLYGPGCVIPGDPDYVVDLAKPFHLEPSMTMLDMSAGLGGPARAVAKAFKTYVAGFERDPDLVRRANDICTAQGLGRQVQISAFDPEGFELRAGHYDHALAREATYNIAQKERFLRVLNQAIKPFGQLIMLDFVRDRSAGEPQQLPAWEATQRLKPLLWTQAQYADCLKSLGFDLRIANDVTADYRRLLLRAWQGFLGGETLRHIKSRQAAPVIDEAERSMRTIAALDSGALKFFYFVALAGRRRGAAGG